MRDQLDDALFEYGRAVRRDAEAAVDPDAALLDHVERLQTAPSRAESTSARRTWLLAAAAVLVVVAVGAVLLVRDERSLQTDEPPATVDTIDRPATSLATTTPSSAPTESTPSSTVAEPPTTLEHEGPPPSTVPLHSRDPQDSGIARSCAGDACTQLVADQAGMIVSYDPATRVLTRHSIPEVSAQVPFDGSVYLVAAGTDGAVYIQTPTSDVDPIGDVVAVSLLDGDAGREIDRVVGAADLSGDSDLVATTEGLVRVSCCGADQIRPAVDAPVVMPWVGPTASETYPVRTLRYDTDGWVRGDMDWQLDLGADATVRGMPALMATLDGGFIGAFSDITGSRVTLARGRPDGTVSQVDIDEFPALLEPLGTVMFGDGDRFTRIDHFGATVRAEPIEWGLNIGPNGEWQLNPYTVNDDIDAEHPTWAASPVSWGDAFGGALDPGATRSVTTATTADDVTVTVVTDNSLDSTLRAFRFVLQLTRGDDGLYRFVTGEYDLACWPNHGHQDFQPANCI